MKNTIHILFFLLFISCSVSAQQFVNSSGFPVLKDKVQQRDFIQAWQLAQQHIDEYQGDADFDFLYGIAALESGHAEVAVFAFERVVANKPNWLDAQFYLAKAYLGIKDYQTAIKLSDELMRQPHLPAQLLSASKTVKETAKIRLNKQALFFQQQLSGGLGYDSNITAGVDEDNIFLPFLDTFVALNDASKENSDNYASLFYQLSGSKSLTQNAKLLFFTQANIHQFFNETDYNRLSLAGSLSYLQEFGYFNASAGVSVKPLWFSGEYYRTQASFDTSINKRINQQWLFSGDLSLGKTKNAVNDFLDTDDLVLSVSGQYFIGNWRHSASLSYLDQQSQSIESEHNSSKSNSINVNTLWLLNQKWLISASLNWQQQTFDGLQPFYLEQRVDDFVMLTTMLQFTPSASWSYKLTASAQERDSNLALFSYQRFDLGLTASLNF